MTHSEDDMPQITLCIRRKNSDALPSVSGCRIMGHLDLFCFAFSLVLSHPLFKLGHSNPVDCANGGKLCHGYDIDHKLSHKGINVKVGSSLEFLSLAMRTNRYIDRILFIVLLLIDSLDRHRIKTGHAPCWSLTLVSTTMSFPRERAMRP